MMKTSGIYSIKNTVNGKFYIGLSTDINSRFKYHLKKLKAGSHVNSHLQSAFIKYNETNFEFSVIELCDENLLNDREKFWIAEYKSCYKEFGYNKTHGGAFGRVSDEIIKQRNAKLRLLTLSKDHKAKISATLSGFPRLYARRFSDETESQIVLEFKILGIKPLARKYECSTTLIYDILNRNNVIWKKRK